MVFLFHTARGYAPLAGPIALRIVAHGGEGAPLFLLTVFVPLVYTLDMEGVGQVGKRGTNCSSYGR